MSSVGKGNYGKGTASASITAPVSVHSTQVGLEEPLTIVAKLDRQYHDQGRPERRSIFARYWLWFVGGFAVLAAILGYPRFRGSRASDVPEMTNYMVSTFAGTGIKEETPDVDGQGTAASFEFPFGVAVDSKGTVYVTDYYFVRKITPGGYVSTFAGSNYSAESVEEKLVDGQGSSARFNTPSGIAVDSNGTVYVTDIWNNAIRKITPDGYVSTLAGSNVGPQGTIVDGQGSAARFYRPRGIAVDSNGVVYVAILNTMRFEKFLEMVMSLLLQEMELKVTLMVKEGLLYSITHLESRLIRKGRYIFRTAWA